MPPVMLETANHSEVQMLLEDISIFSMGGVEQNG